MKLGEIEMKKISLYRRDFKEYSLMESFFDDVLEVLFPEKTTEEKEIIDDVTFVVDEYHGISYTENDC